MSDLKFGVPVVSCRTVSHKDRNPPSPFPFTPACKTDGKFYYGVDIQTGNQPEAGTSDSGVYFSLTGSKKSTGSIGFSFFDFRRNQGSHDHVIVETDEDLGEILVVELGNTKNFIDLADAWFVDKTAVFLFENETELVFPCYHWIGNGDSLTTTAKTTTLKDIDSSPVLQKQRSDQLQRQKQRYQWKVFSDEKLPSGMDSTVRDLPVDEQFEKVKNINFSVVDPAKAVVTLGLTAVVNDIDGLNDYAIFANALANDEQKEAVRSLRWVSDVEFGRQILNGVNPVVIRKCSSLPDNFPVTNDMVKGLMSRGKTLSEEMQAGHVYICDLKIMDGLTTRDGCYNVAPLLLLYVNSSNQLVPIAIQLQQQPGDTNPIFLPTDHWLDWLLAKMYYRLAHGQHHELSTHFLSCHAAMGVYSVATRRNLPDSHPIFKLLVPHFRYTIAINTRAVETLINDGGPIDTAFSIGGQGKTELLHRAGKAYNVHWTNLKENISERGVDSADLLPGYYYRDDNLKIWNAMETYARGIVDLFYSSDNDVQEDKEMQEWANDIYTYGFPAYGGVLGHGFPKTITSKQELVKYCTLIMFTGSGQHSSVNFGQFDEYSFAPNAPFAMRQPPPTEKGKVTVQHVLKSLPDEKTVIFTLLLVNQLSKYSDDEVYLRDFPNARFTDCDRDVRKLISEFQDELECISDQIKDRNKELDVPYIYCLPERVTKSITI